MNAARGTYRHPPQARNELLVLLHLVGIDELCLEKICQLWARQSEQPEREAHLPERVEYEWPEERRVPRDGAVLIHAHSVRRCSIPAQAEGDDGREHVDEDLTVIR